MLANTDALFSLISDRSYEKKIDGHLLVLQDDKWRRLFAILKSNILFLFESESRLNSPSILILMEDCLVEPSDDNQTGKQYSFSIKFKTTGRVLNMAAPDFKTLGNWISCLTISSMDYMLATKQSLQEKISECAKQSAITSNTNEFELFRLRIDTNMPAYHSKFNECVELYVGNMAILPIKTTVKGPAPRQDDPSAEDIIDEALLYFKPNIFFRQFEIKGAADRTLIYLFLYIIECLKKLQRCQKKLQATKDLTCLALESNLPIPGERAFPFTGLYKPPANAHEEETMRAYLQQLRQELGARLIEKVFTTPDAPPSKWWLCFSRRRFMDKSLSQTM